MGSRDKTLAVLGPKRAGKATTIGCMLFKYGAIDMLTMERFQRDGIRSYGEAATKLKERKALIFDTPKHHVTLLDTNTGQADCFLVVLSADNMLEWDLVKDLPSDKKNMIILINKMDTVDWSEEQFQEIVKGLQQAIENAPVIPISALHGDNIVEKSPKSHWYKGWVKNGESGSSLLEALEVSFQN